MNYKLIIIVDVSNEERANELAQECKEYLNDMHLDLSTEDMVAACAEKEI